MRKVVVAVMMFLLMAGVVYGANTITKKAGDYTVAVTIDKNPPVTGKNSLDISVKDSTGAVITDAKVVVEYSMPAMSGMPAMNYKSNAVLKGQSYGAVIEPSMAGGWNMAIKISRGNKTETAKYTLDVK
jgi:hypothetical protein